VFKRKKRDGNAAGTESAEAIDADEGFDDDEDVDRDGDGGDGGDVVTKVLGATEPAATDGPWDKADAPERTRLDLGGLLVPIPPEVELRVEVGNDGGVIAVVLGDGASSMQVNAFAAPRRAGLWDEVRTEIMQALTEQKGTVEEADGPIGRELRAKVPAEKGPAAPARFIGYDGPRWFIRGLITGPAATDPAQAAKLEDVFRDIVVVRGSEAMAPRDPLPLRLPKDAQEAAAAAAGDAPDRDDLNPFERGPEITEVH
jgi:hypothetical protein